MSIYQFRHDRAGYTGALRVHIESTAPYGAAGAAGLGQGNGFADGIINLAGELKAADGTAYSAAGTAPGEGFIPPEHRLTVYRGSTPISSLSFVPIETSTGIVDINTLLSQGRAVAATPEQLLSLAAVAEELANQNDTYGQTLTAIQLGLDDLEQAQADVQAAYNALAILSATGVSATSKTLLDAKFAAATVGQTGFDTATGNIYIKNSGASNWGTAVTTLVTPAYAGRLATENMLPDGGNLGLFGAGLKFNVGANWTPPVQGTPGPLGGKSILNTPGGWLALNTLRDPISLPANRGPVKVWVYAKFLAGHSNNIYITVINSAGQELLSSAEGATIASLSSTTPKVGTTSDGYGIYEITSKATWPADAVAFGIQLNLNFTKAAGQSEVGGVLIFPAASVPADPSVINPVSRGQRAGYGEEDVRRELYATQPYVLPTASQRLYEWVFDLGVVNVQSDVYAFKVTTDFDMLRRSIPLIDAALALRDDRRSPVTPDFMGVTRPLWGTDSFQPSVDGNMYSARVLASPPHPGVLVHYPLHQALLIYPILLWVEAVEQSQFTPTDLTAKAASYKTLALESLHALDDLYADSTHATNTDNSLLAGEGRYFMRFNTAATGGMRDGYSYIPGGIECPINMDATVAAALFVAYRLTRGFGISPTPEATGFMTKALGIMRRIKRDLYVMDGVHVWHYTRRGTWQNLAWTTTTPVVNPYTSGWTGYTSNSANLIGYGEDFGHVSGTLRGIKECVETAGSVFTRDEVAGMSRTIMSIYWSTPRFMRSFYLPTLEQGWNKGLTAVDHKVPPFAPDLSWPAQFDARLAQQLREWYATGFLTRRYAVGIMRWHGLL
ncbi:hypothetical protein [Deinococcus humi]|uniref:Uncharacterized protein n=1 Tax=Deinococcus humi TaxID=662880 RepID=A0A7W8NFR0_9DEIO|nr:hypothetical protein [Deinococcus humi]MBB5363990.1 hypothetical protein [Deinococcus humi]GGO32739.1 hypothetical protein GCM10008949_30780 [Deinococcus humi]